MQPAMRREFQKGVAHNDQIRTVILDLLKAAYKHDPHLAETIRDILCAESNAEPFVKEGFFGSYVVMRRMMLQLGLMLLQDKMSEWMEAGEIPEGEIQED